MSVFKNSKRKRRIFVVDDHPLVREWLKNLINQQSDLEVCGEAENAADALSGIAATKPELAVIDITLNAASGLELMKDIRIQYPSVAPLVLSMHEEELYAERAMRAGARGYVRKRETSKNILAAIRRVLEGGIYVSQKLSNAMALKFLERHEAVGVAQSRVAQLSDRELEVFELLGQGRSTSEIADQLHLSLKTVQAYCVGAKEKLGLNTAVELLREAILWQESVHLR
ncbi:MAG TPA: response regulator transcription factor [Chthoniobacterales bacterium]|jgi:DNA-binding NarL/FixJ family response regulator|nr:response regulator transcription factor [Chthoniobacterales bacterium]